MALVQWCNGFVFFCISVLKVDREMFRELRLLGRDTVRCEGGGDGEGSGREGLWWENQLRVMR
jgi:hypothetical protein